ncbi:MAG TPA: NnrS family protein [Casimicrobiaceae bacterium]|nr:NnrS family protein [Casimicrobiaceae bacterium]
MTVAEPLVLQKSSPAHPPRQGFALWQLGFRPFYLGASAFACLSIALWAAQYAGWLPRPYLSGPLWHAHEMLFGYTFAVLAGFLFTAVRNWTQKPTPTGRGLAILFALWVAGRVLVLTPFPVAAAIVNVLFPFAVAYAIAIPLAHSANRRNYFFVGLLALIGFAVLAVHLDQLHVAPLPAWAGIQLALDVILFIMTVMGGRVIPMFSNNGVPGCGAVRKPWLERSVLGTTLAVLVADLARVPDKLLLVVLAACAAAQLSRLLLWRPWNTTRVPLVWVLHVAYGWIAIHLALRAFATAGLVSPSLATHALTVGAIGGLTIGMMVRTARGHTGRMLTTDRFEVAAFVAIALAAVVRVFGPLFAPAHYIGTVICGASLWSLGFGIYAVRYWPVLTSPRVDGKPG